MSVRNQGRGIVMGLGWSGCGSGGCEQRGETMDSHINTSRDA